MNPGARQGGDSAYSSDGPHVVARVVWPRQTSHGLGVSSCGVLLMGGVVPPGGLFVVDRAAGQAAVEDADQPVAQLPQGGMVADPAGAQRVVVATGAG